MAYNFSCLIGTDGLSKVTAPTRIVATVIMAALWYRADHYIFALWFLSSIFFFFPRLISAAADWMSTILPHMVWPYFEFKMV